MNKPVITTGIIALFTLAGATAQAGDLTIPNTFVTATPAVAADVNANFTAVETEVDDNAADIATNVTSISGNTADIATNTSAIATNAAAITGKASAAAVTTNTTNISANTTNITANTSAAAANATAIAGKAATATVTTNTTNIGTNTTDIDTNTTDIGTNTSNISALQGGVPGSSCTGVDGNDIMVRVGPLCVDKYEASVWDTADGSNSGTQYGDGSDDYLCVDNGNDCTGGTAIYARSESNTVIKPSTYITWFQAQQACASSGKRLLTNAEWQMAVAGTPDPGPAGSDTANECNTNTGATVATGASTGGTNQCVSNWGVYDMVGNVHEWVADWMQGSDVGSGDSVDDSTTPDVSGVSSNSGTGAGTNYGADNMAETTPATTQGTNSTNMPAAIYRGGMWSAGTNAGAFAMSLSSAPSASDSRIGFRCAR